MPFDLNVYHQKRIEVIELIKATHAWETNEGFIADGIINPHIYNDQKLKVLVILAESYGYDECGEINIEEQQEEDYLGVTHPRRQTPRKIAALLWLLFKSLDTNRELQREEFPKLFISNLENHKELQNALSRAAYINVKKPQSQ